jgi:hypothetical protein
MKKYFIAIPIVLIISLVSCFTMSPVYAQDYPFPPLTPEESWQPPYVGGGTLEPRVGVETYGHTWSNLLISPPAPVAPGVPSSIINAYLVNSYGKVLTDLNRNEACYLVVSFNGPGYFYLWEYYPSGTATYGHWLCYKWYRPNAGIWRIGPFAAESLDPAGQYTWKMWFLSGYTWSTRSLNFNYTRSYYPPDIPGLRPGTVSPPVVNSFSASKTSIETGETAILNWTISNAVSVTISPGVGTVGSSGSTSVTPTSTTVYTLTAKGKSGDSVSSTATITVMPRIPPSISVGQVTIQRGKSTALSWNAPGAIKVSITGIGPVNNSGTTTISPDKMATYTLTASYIDGTTQSTSRTVYVEQPPYLLWGLIFCLAVAAILILFLIFKRPRKVYQAQMAGTQTGHIAQSDETHSTDTLPATTPVMEAAPAKLIMPGGNEILLAGNARAFGRHDFEEFMPAEAVSYISRQHVNIWYENGQYFTEDRSSTNGTRVNGMDIKGTGRRALADGDIIELAGKLNITFKGNINKEV